MDIQRAKEEIKQTVRAYLACDDTGAPLIPPVRQRPILLMGPPGVGKTQIMEQIAAGVRRCAGGLHHHPPHPAKRRRPALHPGSATYGGKTRSVTEYTMSEIIASVYAAMERTGKQNGILFIDEINCVSETLAPTMLQFLQCKTFGNQARARRAGSSWRRATRRSTTRACGSSTWSRWTACGASTLSRS